VGHSSGCHICTFLGMACLLPLPGMFVVSASRDSESSIVPSGVHMRRLVVYHKSVLSRGGFPGKGCDCEVA